MKLLALLFGLASIACVYQRIVTITDAGGWSLFGWLFLWGFCCEFSGRLAYAYWKAAQ